MKSYKGKGSAGYLNIISSLIHNFFDGFAIGVGFASKEKDKYVPIIIAVFAHETPKEMGDVGILFKNSFEGWQTIFCNCVVNLTAVIGVVVGLSLA